MKKKNALKPGFLFVVFFVAMLQGNAQTLKDVFSNSETSIFYLGIDFTKAKLIDDATANVNDIRDRQYDGINDVVVNEPKKYDLKSAFHRNSMDHDLGLAAKRNEKANAEEIKSTSSSDFHRFKEDDIKSIIGTWDFGGKKGIGLIFVMEAMSKSEKAAAMWVTLVDMSSKKVLMTERMEGKASMSFGFRNYWATTIKSVIDRIEKKAYDEWKSKYGN